ncbi:MAG: pyridoxamine 5'-phosphate oxidase family protein, partial [Pseudomonadota bacterium]
MTDSKLDTEEALRDVYAKPAKAVIDKNFPTLDKHSRRFLELSPFFCIGSSRTDISQAISSR